MRIKGEKKLIKMARSGDKEAFGRLVEVYGDMIYGLCIKLTGSNSEAEDLAQDTFHRALENIKKFKEKSNFSTWLFKITRNLWVDRYRRKRKIELLPLDNKDGLGGSISDTTIAGKEELSSRELKDAFIRAFSILSQREEFMVNLFINENKSYKEIAEICGCALGTVSVTISNGMKKLIKHLKSIYKQQ